MINLPFDIPTKISVEKADKYDGGYLRKLFPKLVQGDPIVKKDEIKNVFSEMGIIHESILLYSLFQGELQICNYAYEDVKFLPFRKRFEGRCFHITGHDGTQSDGDISHFGRLSDEDPKDFPSHVIPYYIKNNQEGLKGLLVARKFPGSHNLQFMIGDGYENYSERIPVMPTFRGRERPIRFAFK